MATVLAMPSGVGEGRPGEQQDRVARAMEALAVDPSQLVAGEQAFDQRTHALERTPARYALCVDPRGEALALRGDLRQQCGLLGAPALDGLGVAVEARQAALVPGEVERLPEAVQLAREGVGLALLSLQGGERAPHDAGDGLARRAPGAQRGGLALDDLPTGGARQRLEAARMQLVGEMFGAARALEQGIQVVLQGLEVRGVLRRHAGLGAEQRRHGLGAVLAEGGAEGSAARRTAIRGGRAAPA